MRAAFKTIAVLGLLTAACQPSASETPSRSEPPESAAPSVESTPTPLPVGWQVTTFGGTDGPAIARDVTSFEEGFVAVGVEFSEALPNLGPTPPHEGRIWLSSDGWSWEDVTPTAELENIDLTEVFLRSDGTLVAHGVVSVPNADGTGVDPSQGAAWESSDGQAWQAIDLPIPVAQRVQVESGALGFIALVYPGVDNEGATLWFSTEGSAWAQVREMPFGFFDLDAGDEGFVVVGDTHQADEANFEPYIIASADGHEWIRSEDDPAGAFYAAALGGDWITVTWDFAETVTSWLSANGLDWAESGTVAVETVNADAQTICREYPTGLASTGSHVILTTTLSGPCSEGGFIINKGAFLTTDSVTWEALPFPDGVVGEAQSGSRVDGAAENDRVLVLAGQLDGQAALWTIVND
ncbi:MAG TPA: hypothetical protein VIC63_06470 [Candidatus Limnocylindria bacterium]|jgi:hypothetical protein